MLAELGNEAREWRLYVDHYARVLMETNCFPSLLNSSLLLVIIYGGTIYLPTRGAVSNNFRATKTLIKMHLKKYNTHLIAII